VDEQEPAEKAPPQASVRALLSDLLGEDPEVTLPQRPTVRQARRRCPRGAVMPCRHGDRPLLLAVLNDGRTYTMPDRCPHDGGPLGDGFLDGKYLVCARHGWEFDLTTGTCVGRPGVALRVRVEPDSP